MEVFAVEMGTLEIVTIIIFLLDCFGIYFAVLSDWKIRWKISLVLFYLITMGLLAFLGYNCFIR